jgi:hypothetical protein
VIDTKTGETCPTCGKVLKNKLALAAHKGRVHGGKPLNEGVVGPAKPNGIERQLPPTHVEKAEFHVVEQEPIQLEKVEGLTSGTTGEIKPPTPQQEMASAGSAFKTTIKMLANRWNDSLTAPETTKGPEAFAITDSEIEDLSMNLEAVLAKHGGDKGAAEFLAKYGAEIGLLVVSMFFVGKIIGGLNAKKKLRSGGGENPVEEKKNLVQVIAEKFQRKEGEGNSNVTDRELEKIAGIEYEKYWKGIPGGGVS